MVTVVAAVTLYVAAWIGWSAQWGWLIAVDYAALDVTHRFGLAHPGWVTFWNALCTVFSPVTFRVLVLGLIVWALMRRQRRVALFLFVSVELTGALTELAKFAADRPRPATALVSASSTSFPSGHAVGTMAAVLALLAVALPAVGRSYRTTLIGAGVLIVVAVGVGRVVLNVHHPSDIVAGWALGYLWFVLCVALLPPRFTAADETPAARDSSP
nr:MULTISPECIES: phosphatase PAP2 family protein [unclassified Mycobacterium]